MDHINAAIYTGTCYSADRLKLKLLSGPETTSPSRKLHPVQGSRYMANEFNAARAALEAALGKYMDACLATRSLDVLSKAQTHTSLNTSNPGLLSKEYLRLASLENRIQQARATILTARNSSFSTVPVNALPVEVMTRIFQIAVNSEPDKLDPWSTGYWRLPKYPIQLTHVCAHWRQIILHTPLFWSHVEIIPLLQSNERFLARALTFVTRATHSALDIHITTRYPTDEYWEAGGLQEFLSPLVPRMRSLDIAIHIEDDEEYDAEPSARDFCSSVLSICFGKSCTPGALTKVSLEMDLGVSLIEASESAHDANCLQLDVPSRHLEDIWRHVTVLRLDGIFPLWTSSAYHGLLELSLVSQPGGTSVISELHLINILSSSPQLRFLSLGLPIEPAHLPYKAVFLPDLEALTLHLSTTRELESAMRMIDPGPKPLRVTVYPTRQGVGETSNKTAEVAKFFARANISALHFVGVSNNFKLLGLVDTIQNLAFTISSSDDINTLISDKPAGLYTETLHILNKKAVNLDIDVLLRLAKAYVPKKFILWGPYRIYGVEIAIRSTSQIEEELSIAGTIAKVRFSEPPKAPEYLFTTC